MRLIYVCVFAVLAYLSTLVVADADDVMVSITNGRTEANINVQFFVHPYNNPSEQDLIHSHDAEDEKQHKLHYFTHSPLLPNFEVAYGDELIVTHSKYANQQVRIEVPPPGDWFFADFPEGSDKSTHELAVPFMYLSTGQLLTHGFPVRSDESVSGVTVPRALGVDAIAEQKKITDAIIQAQIEKEREEHLKQDSKLHDEL